MRILNLVIKYLFLFLFFINVSYAFKPDIWRRGEDPVSHAPFLATDVLHSHVGITETALRNVIDDDFGLKFSSDAVEYISQANKEIDNQESDTASSPTHHCDNEEIHACTKRILKEKSNIIDALKINNGLKARRLLGGVLHTLQDFYSHSNWVNISHSGSLAEYTKAVAGTEIATLGEGFPLSSPDSSTKFSFFGPELFEARSRMCTWETGDLIRAGLYEAIDYSGILSLTNLAPTNRLRENGLSEVTSGYFIVPSVLQIDLPEKLAGIGDPALYKCDHGVSALLAGLFDLTGIVVRIGTEEERGLNKDHSDQPNFFLALTAARTATQDFVEQILKHPDIAGNEERIREFLDQPKEQSGSLGFIVDTTGSMGATVTGIKNAISTIVSNIEDDPNIDVTDFLVMSYGDPGIGSVFIANSPSEMQSFVENITLGVPDGGGDSPERAFVALQKAVNEASDGSILYLYTDAKTKEEELAEGIVSNAKKKNITINFFISNPAIKEYYENLILGAKAIFYEHTISGAKNTVASIETVFSGDSHPVLDISDKIGTTGEKLDLGSLLDSTRVNLNITEYIAPDGNSAMHFMPLAHGLLVQKSEYDFTAIPKDYHINVDESVSSMSISVSMAPLGEIRLFYPDGREAVDTDTNIEITKSSVNQFITVTFPEIGQWKLTVTGNDGVEYDVSVKMNTDIRFISFDFVEEKGRFGHTGLFPIDGQPLLTGTQNVISTFTGEISTAELVLVSLSGEELKKITLTELSKTSSSVKYFGTIDLPLESFRIRAQGTDKDGNNFERIYPVVYKGQSVSVTTSPIQNSMVPDSTFNARFILKNTGVSDTFKLNAVNTSEYDQSVNISEITLKPDESKEIEVIMDIPSSALDGDRVTTTLIATSTTNLESTNSASHEFIVEADSDQDGVPDAVEKGSNDYDGNGDGIADYTQNKVASFYAFGSNAFITLEVIDNGTLSAVRGTPAPSSTNELHHLNFLLNLVDYKIIALTPGSETRIKFYYPEYINVTELYKHGSTETNTTDHWYKVENAIIETGTATFTLKDGSVGDGDLVADGVIVDPIALGVLNATIDITVTPPIPIEGKDEIMVTLSDTWPNGCIPNSASYSIDGNIIDIILNPELSSSDFCIQGITPWSIDVSLGTLPTGDYTIYVDKVLNGSRAQLGTKPFSVSSEAKDSDSDGINDDTDNCPSVANPAQKDTDNDGNGDACECGDFSGDGIVNTGDARLIQRCVTGKIPCAPLCDVTGDKQCSTADARLIQRFAVGKLGKEALKCEARP